mmetsp:Transcript_20755/g.39466  ORF Transcript_20755/g.39466 Transcript_20755/m.39466 type:complete len:217 (-) Transcript_20755:251-901(-)
MKGRASCGLPESMASNAISYAFAAVDASTTCTESSVGALAPLSALAGASIAGSAINGAAAVLAAPSAATPWLHDVLDAFLVDLNFPNKEPIEAALGGGRRVSVSEALLAPVVPKSLSLPPPPLAVLFLVDANCPPSSTLSVSEPTVLLVLDCPNRFQGPTSCPCSQGSTYHQSSPGLGTPINSSSASSRRRQFALSNAAISSSAVSIVLFTSVSNG